MPVPALATHAFSATGPAKKQVLNVRLSHEKRRHLGGIFSDVGLFFIGIFDVLYCFLKVLSRTKQN